MHLINDVFSLFFSSGASDEGELRFDFPYIIVTKTFALLVYKESTTNPVRHCEQFQRQRVEPLIQADRSAAVVKIAESLLVKQPLRREGKVS